MKPGFNIAFLHPDLGLGGAERVVVDAALQLQAAGHRVTIFTAHHDPRRCFEATRDGRLDVCVHGDFLPLHLAQRLRAPCAIARMLYLAAALARSGVVYDAVCCDLVAHVIPMVRWWTRSKILFFCHFPDQLLTPRRHRWYRLYRAPIDRWETAAMGMADRVLVNSQFTAARCQEVFKSWGAVEAEVVHPGVDATGYPRSASGTDDDRLTIACINRYAPQKNLGLAIDALAGLRRRLPAPQFARLQLVIAGGYDRRWRESHGTWRDLQTRAAGLGLDRAVVFLRSPTDPERVALLARCLCVVYTPEDEHFGFGPIEAMAAGKPVIAVNSGGVCETVEHETTGMLCPPTAEAFAAALHRLIDDPATAVRMGSAGRERVRSHFSVEAFGARLESILRDVVA